MDNNVVSFQKKAERRYETLQQKVMHGIDSKELHKYYDLIVKGSIEHLSYLQKYLAEEFLGDSVIDSFTMGVEASKLHQIRRLDEIEQVFSDDLSCLLIALLAKHELIRFLPQEDIETLNNMAKELVESWFRKGVIYGEKQRKLRLM